MFLEFINQYGLWAVFFLIILEYACFPVPSELVLPFAGAYAAQTGRAFILVLLLSIGAGLLGALICYAIGYFGGGAFVDKMAKKFPKSRSGLEASQQWFEKYGNLSVMIGRVLPLCRTYISFAAGVVRQSPLPFILNSAVGITVWNLVLVGLGYTLGANWGVVTIYAERYKYILLPVVLLLIFAVILNIIKKNKKSRRFEK